MFTHGFRFASGQQYRPDGVAASGQESSIAESNCNDGSVIASKRVDSNDVRLSDAEGDMQDGNSLFHAGKVRLSDSEGNTHVSEQHVGEDTETVENAPHAAEPSNNLSRGEEIRSLVEQLRAEVLSAGVTVVPDAEEVHAQSAPHPEPDDTADAPTQYVPYPMPDDAYSDNGHSAGDAVGPLFVLPPRPGNTVEAEHIPMTNMPLATENGEHQPDAAHATLPADSSHPAEIREVPSCQNAGLSVIAEEGYSPCQSPDSLGNSSSALDMQMQRDRPDFDNFVSNIVVDTIGPMIIEKVMLEVRELMAMEMSAYMEGVDGSLSNLRDELSKVRQQDIQRQETPTASSAKVGKDTEELEMKLQSIIASETEVRRRSQQEMTTAMASLSQRVDIIRDEVSAIAPDTGLDARVQTLSEKSSGLEAQMDELRGKFVSIAANVAKLAGNLNAQERAHALLAVEVRLGKPQGGSTRTSPVPSRQTSGSVSLRPVSAGFDRFRLPGVPQGQSQPRHTPLQSPKSAGTFVGVFAETPGETPGETQGDTPRGRREAADSPLQSVQQLSSWTSSLNSGPAVGNGSSKSTGASQNGASNWVSPDAAVRLRNEIPQAGGSVSMVTTDQPPMELTSSSSFRSERSSLYGQSRAEALDRVRAMQIHEQAFPKLGAGSLQVPIGGGGGGDMSAAVRNSSPYLQQLRGGSLQMPIAPPMPAVGAATQPVQPQRAHSPGDLRSTSPDMYRPHQGLSRPISPDPYQNQGLTLQQLQAQRAVPAYGFQQRPASPAPQSFGPSPGSPPPGMAGAQIRMGAGPCGGPCGSPSNVNRPPMGFFGPAAGSRGPWR